MSLDNLKILLIGLDNAGKTTFLSLIQDKFVNAVDIQPTKGVSRKNAEILGNQIVIHDMGGQKSYRESYLQKPGYLDKSDALIYLVDIQDPERYSISLDYFKRSLEVLASIDHKVTIYLLFHKFDGDYKKEFHANEKFRGEYDDLLVKFMDIANDVGFKIGDTFQTSIQDEWSCYHAISKVWTLIIKRIEGIHQFLSKIVDDNPEIEVGLLLDKKANMLAYILRKIGDKSVKQLEHLAGKSIHLFLEWQLSLLDDVNDILDSTIINLEKETILIQEIKTASGDFYVTVYCKEGNYTKIQEHVKSISYLLGIFLSVTS